MIKTRFILLSLMIVFAIAVIGQSHAAPANLMPNGGFESGSSTNTIFHKL